MNTYRIVLGFQTNEPRGTKREFSCISGVRGEAWAQDIILCDVFGTQLNVRREAVMIGLSENEGRRLRDQHFSEVGKSQQSRCSRRRVRALTIDRLGEGRRKNPQTQVESELETPTAPKN